MDPGFAEQFHVAAPTPRYAHVLRALPAVLVATAERTSRAATIVAFEMACMFKHQGIALPPWRCVDRVAGMWDVSLVAGAEALKTTYSAPRAPALLSHQHAWTPALRTLGFKTARDFDQLACSSDMPETKQEQSQQAHEAPAAAAA